jgi:hypothetical protein
VAMLLALGPWLALAWGCYTGLSDISPPGPQTLWTQGPMSWGCLAIPERRPHMLAGGKWRKEQSRHVHRLCLWADC